MKSLKWLFSYFPGSYSLGSLLVLQGVSFAYWSFLIGQLTRSKIHKNSRPRSLHPGELRKIVTGKEKITGSGSLEMNVISFNKSVPLTLSVG